MIAKRARERLGQRHCPLAALTFRVVFHDCTIDTEARLVDREGPGVEIDVPVPAQAGGLASPQPVQRQQPGTSSRSSRAACWNSATLHVSDSFWMCRGRSRRAATLRDIPPAPQGLEDLAEHVEHQPHRPARRRPPGSPVRPDLRASRERVDQLVELPLSVPLHRLGDERGHASTRWSPARPGIRYGGRVADKPDISLAPTGAGNTHRVCHAAGRRLRSPRSR
jgi:hypothetical protein